MNVLSLLFSVLLLSSCTHGPSLVFDKGRITTSEGALVYHFDRPLGGKAPKKFRFLVIGDSRPGSVIAHRQVVNQMAKHPADLYVHLGDFVNGGANIPEWIEFFSIQSPLLYKMPMIPVIGNHDLSEEQIFSKIFLSHTSVPPETRYFTVDYGRIVFIVLDSNNGIAKDSQQYEFLVNELKAAKARNVDHIFVTLHHPLWSSSIKHGNNEALQETLAPLFSEYAVSAVFSGHDHNYERIRPQNGVHYFVSGGAGSPLRAVRPSPDSAVALVSFHFLEVNVDGKELSVNAVDQNGNIIDSVKIR